MKVEEFDAGVITAESPEKLVEIVGRTCYKSEDRITEDSYKSFISNLIKRHHFAMLEHGRITFKLKFENSDDLVRFKIKIDAEIIGLSIPKIYTDTNWADNVIYWNVSMSHIYNPRYSTTFLQHYTRLTYENGDQTVPCSFIADHNIVIERVYDLTNESVSGLFKDQATHISVKFLCDRGVSHELVRHRFAIGQESQRYCRYGSGKFGDDISFILPTELEGDDVSKLLWKDFMKYSEQIYLKLLSNGASPQNARSCLPNSTKTEVILTANILEWIHFFDMRLRGTTGKPHPDMVKVARIAHTSIKRICGNDL